MPRSIFTRVEADTAHQHTILEIRDGACAAVLGTGAAYRLMGVSFRAIPSADIPVSDDTVVIDDGIPIDPPLDEMTRPAGT